MKEQFSRRTILKGAVGALLMGAGVSYPIANEIRNRDLVKRVDRAEAEDRVRNRLIKDNVEMSVFAISGIEIDNSTFKTVFDRAVERVQGGLSEWHPDLLSQEIQK